MFSRKKIMALVMLLNVASPLVFFTGYFAKQKLLEHKMEEKLERASLHTIAVNLSDVRWVKKNKEVAIAGKLFDVKSFYTRGGKIILTGLYDHEEQELEKEFAAMLHGKKDKPSPFQQLILKFIFSPFFDKNPSVSIASFCVNTPIEFPVYIEIEVSQTLSVNTPPPNA